MRKTLIVFIMVTIAATLAAQESSATLIAKGLNAEQKGLMERAEAYYRQAYEVDPTGEAALRLGLFEQKREHYEQAIVLYRQTDDERRYAPMAYCQSELQQWDSASHYAELAIESGDTLSAMLTMALCESARQRQTNALAWANRVMKAVPQDSRAHNVLGVIMYRKGNDAEALRLFRKAVQLDSNNVDAYFNLGSMYYLRNNYESSIQTLRRGLRRFPRSIKLYICLGQSYQERGDAEHAIQCYQSILQQDSTHQYAIMQLGRIHQRKGDYESAKGYYTRVISINPNNDESYKALGETYTQWGDYTKAIRTYQKALQIDPDDGETYCLIAELYHRQGNTQREINSYKKAAKLGQEKAQQWLIGKGLSW